MEQKQQSSSVKRLWELCCSVVKKSMKFSVDELCELPGPLVFELAVGLHWHDLMKLEDVLKSKIWTEKAWKHQYDLIPRYKKKWKEQFCSHCCLDPGVSMSFREKWFSFLIVDYLAGEVARSIVRVPSWKDEGSFCPNDDSTPILVAEQVRKVTVQAAMLTTLQRNPQLLAALATNLVDLRITGILHSQAWLQGLHLLMANGQSLKSLQLDLHYYFSDQLLLLFIASGMSQCRKCAQLLSAVRARMREMWIPTGRKAQQLKADDSNTFLPDSLCSNIMPVLEFLKSNEILVGKDESSGDRGIERKDLIQEEDDSELSVPEKGSWERREEEARYNSDLTVSATQGKLEGRVEPIYDIDLTVSATQRGLEGRDEPIYDSDLTEPATQGRLEEKDEPVYDDLTVSVTQGRLEGRNEPVYDSDQPENGENDDDLWDECLAPLESPPRKALTSPMLILALQAWQRNLYGHSSVSASGSAGEEEDLEAVEKLFRMILPAGSLSREEFLSLYIVVDIFLDSWMSTDLTGKVLESRPQQGTADGENYLRILKALSAVHSEEGHACLGVEHFSASCSQRTVQFSCSGPSVPMYLTMVDVLPCWPSLSSLSMDVGIDDDEEWLLEYDLFLDTVLAGIRKGRIQKVALTCYESHQHVLRTLSFFEDALKCLSASDPTSGSESLRPMELLKLSLESVRSSRSTQFEDQSPTAGSMQGHVVNECRTDSRGLQMLCLEGEAFNGVNAFCPVADFISKDACLEHLSLRNCYLNRDSVDLLFQALSNTDHQWLSCVDLTMSIRRMTDAQWVMVCSLVNRASLTTLSLAQCGLRAHHVRHAGFQSAVRSHKQQRSLTLDLSSNFLENGVWDFMDETVNPESSLKVLHMKYTECGEDIGLQMVTEMTRRYKEDLPLLQYSSWSFHDHRRCKYHPSDLCVGLSRISQRIFHVFSTQAEYLAMM